MHTFTYLHKDLSLCVKGIQPFQATSSRKLVFSQIKSHILAISEFEAKLSIFVGKHVERIKGCSVRLISTGKPYCLPPPPPEICFKSKSVGTHIFSAGFFTFKPELGDQIYLMEKNLP
ncbi:hypothetical protein R6Q59_033961 [Mikania micrantha]